jgi:AhpD family alkylhydroperoxidase
MIRNRFQNSPLSSVSNPVFLQRRVDRGCGVGGNLKPFAYPVILEDNVSHYHDSDDLKILKDFKQLAPEEFAGFVALDAIVGREDGAIPRKYRELIALAVACTTQCPYCLDVHTRGAKRAGASREEVAEASLLAAALRAGAAVTHGALAVRLFDNA